MNIQELKLRPLLSEFIKKLSREISLSENPLIYLEFRSSGSNNFQSRIAIFGVDSHNSILYRYAHSLEAPMREWPLNSDYHIERIVPPGRLSSPKCNLGIIQVNTYDS